MLERDNIPLSPAAAIGAFYGTYLDQGDFSRLLKVQEEGQSRGEDVFSVYFSIESSNIPVAPPEVQVALCVTGESSSDAVCRLKRVAQSLNLESGQRWT